MNPNLTAFTFRYLVLANMLSSSDINPFDSAEAKALSGNHRLRVCE
jgi:hypothetical protein